jgi:hypothetical protein
MGNGAVLQSLGDAGSNAESVWKEIAREMKGEQDPDRMVALWKQLDRIMLDGQRQRVQPQLDHKRRGRTKAQSA